MLCHRDYHSRNLMLHDGQLYIIDFQDARMGPDTYDLVSLLRDSYVDLPEQTVDELIAYFLALKGASGDASAEFRRAVRPDGAAAQPQGARHVRLPDDRPRATRSTSSTSRARCATSATTSSRLPRFGRLRELLADARRGVPVGRAHRRPAVRLAQGVRAIGLRASDRMADPTVDCSLSA